MTKVQPTLLVVDDDLGVLDVVDRIARPLGFLVERRGGGGLPDLLTGLMPDVALLDMHASQGLAWPSCPVFVMSSQVTIDAAIDAMKAGASDYLAKPLDAARLHCALTTARTEIEQRRTHETGLYPVTRKYAAVGGIDRSVVAVQPSEPSLHAADQAPQPVETVAGREQLVSDTIIDALPGIVYFSDQQGRFLRWNSNFESASGHSAEEIAHMHPLDFFMGDDRHRVRQLIAEVFESGQSSVEARLVAKDGRATPYYFTGCRVIVDGKPCLVGMGVDNTERWQAGERLAESERKYRELVEHANSIILRWNADGRIRFLNEFGLRFFGYSEEEILGRDVIGTLVPAVDTSGRDLERLMQQIRRDPTAFEQNVNENIRRGGERVLIAWTNRIGHDADGHIAEILSVGTDITQQKQAEDALRASEARYYTLFECAPDGIFIANREGRCIGANTRACRMLGYDRDELIGSEASALVGEAGLEHVRAALVSTTATSHHRGEWSFSRKDGTRFPAEVFATVMPDGNLLEMIRDVSERNAALEALRTAEERMRFVLENAEVGIWDQDYAAGVVRWSETLEFQYGLAPGTFGGTFEAFVERIHPEDREAVVDTITKATASGGDFSILNRATRLDGSVRWLSGTGRVLVGDRGKAVRSVGISLDVTERRMLEAQYQQAQKMEIVGRLAGSVAHDFNNLLTAILGYCEFLLSDLDPADPRHSDIEEIQKAGTRATGLTRQLVAFSRKQIIEPARLSLNVVLADVRGMLKRLIGEDVDIALRLNPDLAPVLADRGQVEQILMNLAVNARDAMPRGGTLTIETTNVEFDARDAALHYSVKPGPYVELTVSDTGTGMAPEVLARLFEPFFTTKPVGKGTGLGLATIHAIVAASGGGIWVRSTVGEGSSFKVCLPRAEVPEIRIDPIAALERPRAGETVLLVEDERELRDLIARMLEREGYKVVVAANATEALEMFEQHAEIAVILTDVVMPGASGVELTRRLTDRRPMQKVIYMSGYTDDAIAHHGVLKPGIAFLHKPFTSESIGRKIREVLGR